VRSERRGMASSVYHHFRPAVGGDGPAALDGVSDLATDVDDAPNLTGSTNARGSRSATPKNRAMGKGDESGKGRGSAKGPSADHNSAQSPREWRPDTKYGSCAC